MEHSTYPKIGSRAKFAANPMMESYMHETRELPYRLLRDVHCDPPPIASPQDGKQNSNIKSVVDTSMRVHLDTASLQSLHDLSYRNKLDEAEHEGLARERRSGKQIYGLFLRSEDTTGLFPYIGSWSMLDGRPAPPELNRVLPNAGAKIAPNANFTTEPQRVDVVRLRQHVKEFYATLSRYAHSGHIPGAIQCSPGSTDIAPTNPTTAAGKTTSSSKKRSLHSKQKPKSRGNNERGNSESENDDDHRDTRQKTADKPPEKVESRLFACPFYKLYPRTHWRKCRERCYPITRIHSVQVFAQDANSQSFNYVQKQAFC